MKKYFSAIFFPLFTLLLVRSLVLFDPNSALAQFPLAENFIRFCCFVSVGVFVARSFNYRYLPAIFSGVLLAFCEYFLILIFYLWPLWQADKLHFIAYEKRLLQSFLIAFVVEALLAALFAYVGAYIAKRRHVLKN